MSNYSDIKRKHFRFPAYDDQEGVKIKQDRPGFGQDENWILTEMTEDSRGEVQRSTESTSRTLRRTPKSTQEKYGHSIQQREELKQHKQNLPDYTARNTMDKKLTGKPNLFGDSNNRSTYKVKSKRQDAEQAAMKKEYSSGRSYFVPKYIPASIIPDEVKTESSEQDLLQSMEKPQNSYLLFDTEPAAYQAKDNEDPTVKKFNRSNAVNMSRSQYRKSSKEPSEKKRLLLDRSLKGLIEEEKSNTKKNGYFKK